MRKNGKKQITHFVGQTNQEKFQRFYDYRPYVENTIYNSKVTDNTFVSIQDVLQEIYCKIWLEIDTFDFTKYTPYTYIKRRTEAVISDTRRKFKSQKRSSQGGLLYIDDEEF